MTLIKYHNEVPSFNGLFDELLKEKTRFSSLPKANILEDETGYEIELAVPGMKKEDFKIELDNQVLTISAEKSEKEVDKKYSKKEFGYFEFKRSFRLPEIAKAEKIAASYKEGILTISIPKAEKAKPKVITIS